MISLAFWHYSSLPESVSLFYSNQPPNEPRERDYVLAGSIFCFCIWIGMGVLALTHILRTRVNLNAKMAGPIAFALALSAPLLMGFPKFR